MRVEIICTGDEVLTGKIVNSNFSHISQRLEDVGLTVVWGTTVGDDRAALLEAFQRASMRADAVIVNGGLGPTLDDLSQEIAARAAGVELVLHEEWLGRMEAFFTKRARVMPPGPTSTCSTPSRRGSKVSKSRRGSSFDDAACRPQPPSRPRTGASRRMPAAVRTGRGYNGARIKNQRQLKDLPCV